MARFLPDLSKCEAFADRANYKAPFLAKLCGVSPRHMRRQFNCVLGKSPQRWLDEYRLRRAMELLCSAKMVKHVSLTLKFKCFSHFCRQFKLFTGMTPSQFIAWTKGQSPPTQHPQGH